MIEFNESIQMIMVSLKIAPHKTHLVLSQMNNLSSEELPQLYAWMLTDQMQAQNFNCFKELFKSPDKFSHLVSLFTTVPVIHQQLLTDVVTALNETSLIDLIEQLLIKTKEKSEFTETLNHVLSLFCQRLYIDQSPDTVIHQWEKRGFAAQLGHHLLANPELIFNLTEANSTVYSWLTWSSIAQALKHRIDAVLNQIEINSNQLKEYAFIWVDYFRAQPDNWYTLFTNLQYSKVNRTKQGEQNLSSLKISCWELLRSGETYKEEEFAALLYAQKKEVFASIQPVLYPEPTLPNRPHDYALWLAKSTDVIPPKINPELLITILLHSTHEKTLINWTKAKAWLNMQEPEAQFEFIKTLIEQAGAKKYNPSFNLQAHQLIIQHPHFAHFFSEFKEVHCSWLIRYAGPDCLREHLPLWLKTLLVRHNEKSINLGEVFALLPPKKDLLAQLLTKDSLNTPELVADIFAVFHLKADCPPHLLSLHQLISKQENLWVKQFLRSAISQINGINKNLVALFILNNLMISQAPHLSIQEPEDKKLMGEYLKQLLTLIHTLKNEQHRIELKQIVTNLLTTLMQKEEDWHQFLFAEPIFNELILVLLHDSGSSSPQITLEHHPLIDLFITAKSPYLDIKLKQDGRVQQLIQYMLLKPPEKLNPNQFKLLFGWLLPENQTILAKLILGQPQLHGVHQNSLKLLINSINPTDLFALLDKHINQSLQEPSYLVANTAQMIKLLAPEEALTALKKQLETTQDLDGLTAFFTPFNTEKNNLLPLLHNARWQHRLLLIHGGLLEALRFYNDKQTTAASKKLIETSTLYQHCLAPLLTSTSACNLGSVLLTSLYPYLKEYLDIIAPTEQAQAKKIQNILDKYIKQLSTLHHFSLPKLFEQFKPSSALAVLNTQGEGTLNDEDATLLMTASSAQQECFSQKGIDPKTLFANTLSLMLKDENTMKHDPLNEWIMTSALFSSTSMLIEEQTLKNYLSQISPTKLSLFIQIFADKKQLVQEAWQILQTNSPSTSAAEWLKHFLAYESDMLRRLSQACGILNLRFLNELLLLAISINDSTLNEEQIDALFLSPAISQHQDCHWLQLDLKLMQERIAQSSTRLQQLIVLSFSYNPDNQNEDRLAQLIKQDGIAMTAPILAQCINSYVPLFSKQEFNPNSFLNIVEQCIKNPQISNSIINELNEATVTQIIAIAIEQPEHYSNLLEQLINSTHLKLCEQQLQLRLSSLLKQDTDPQPSNISQLNSQQIEALSPKQLSKLLLTQRLVFFAKPIDEELSTFISSEKEPLALHKKRMFCADASLYQALLKLKKPTLPLDKSMNWLSQHSQNSIKSYTSLINESTTNKDIKEQPALLFHWLRWKSFVFSSLYNDHTILSKELLNWVSSLDKAQLLQASRLKSLLEYCANQQQLNSVFILATTQKPPLSTDQVTWLCENSLELSANKGDLLPYIIQLNSWAWLEKFLEKNTTVPFDLIKTALQNIHYLEEINATEEQQTRLIVHIESKRFTPEQILELIKTTPDPQIKSLLILHLFSQAVYLNSVKGESILNKLIDNDTHTPSRLNALIHQLNISLLTKSRMKKLLPEAAIGILCSIPHFHQFNEELISQLLGKHHQQEVISYWINHYATMPNAYCVLAHLMKLAEVNVLAVFNKMNGQKKEDIINTIIEHLELFDPNSQLLKEYERERHLTLALRLYLNGHNHSSYIKFISRLTEQLIHKNHSFSSQTTQLLLVLHDKAEFNELNIKTAYLINHNLKINAQAGSVELFYDAKTANIQSMTQLIQLKPKHPSTEQGKALFSHLSLPGLIEQESQISLPLRVHPLIEVLAKQEKLIKSFDYFLIHYKGNTKKLTKALHDYLGFYAQEGATPSLRKSLYHISTFITRRELDLPVREAIYTAFLHYPNLYDEHINYCLFLFNAKRTVQYFGLQANKEQYQQVINSCTLALKKLNPNQHQDIIELATKAISEAKIELAFAEDQGFFARLFRRFKRCWIYGWTGFFSPKPPLYVASFDESTLKKKEAPTQATAENDLLEYNPPKDLALLLEELKAAISPQKLNALLCAMNNWRLEVAPKDELNTRYTLHHLFHQLLITGKKNKELFLWLKENEAPFITNRHRLLELLLSQGQQKETLELVEQIKTDSQHFLQLSTELQHPIDEVNPIKTIEHNSQTTPETVQPGILGKAATLAQTAWTWTATNFNFFATQVPVDTAAASSTLGQTKIL